MSRYVPKTYYNRRILRVIVSVVTTVALVAVIGFMLLFFWLRQYVVYTEDGQIRLEIPFLMDETPSGESPDDMDGETTDGDLPIQLPDE